MINIKKCHIDHFKKHGWVNVSMGFENKFLDDCILSLQRMRQKAISECYPARRIYHDHLFTLNLAAIEMPFHLSICDPLIKVAFSKMQLGKAVNHLMSWKNSHCSLARLFTMGNFKYRGNWHRDDDYWNGKVYQQSMVQVGLYFEDQNGFKIFKPEYDFKGSKSIIKHNRCVPHRDTNNIPLDISDKYINIVGGKKGSVLFFCPGLMHQGSSKKRRLDFHMRFTESKKEDRRLLSKNLYQDFKVANYLHETTSIAEMIKQKKIPSQPRPIAIRRLINTVNYILPALNFVKLSKDLIFFKGLAYRHWRKDYLANTIFQKEK